MIALAPRTTITDADYAECLYQIWRRRGCEHHRSPNKGLAFHDTTTRFWIDICYPTEADYALLKDIFGFHPLAIEDTIHEVQRPKLESYALVGDKLKEDYFFLVIHGPYLDPHPDYLFQTTELDIFISRRYLVTVHEQPMVSVEEMAHRVKSDPEVSLNWGIDILLYELLDRLVDKYAPILDDFEETLDKLEELATGDPP